MTTFGICILVLCAYWLGQGSCKKKHCRCHKHCKPETRIEFTIGPVIEKEKH